MRKTAFLTALVLVLGFGTVAAQGTYGIDTAHSSVGFKVRHLVSKVSGGFNDFAVTSVRQIFSMSRSTRRSRSRVRRSPRSTATATRSPAS